MISWFQEVLFSVRVCCREGGGAAAMTTSSGEAVCVRRQPQFVTWYQEVRAVIGCFRVTLAGAQCWRGNYITGTNGFQKTWLVNHSFSSNFKTFFFFSFSHWTKAQVENVKRFKIWKLWSWRLENNRNMVIFNGNKNLLKHVNFSSLFQEQCNQRASSSFDEFKTYPSVSFATTIKLRRHIKEMQISCERISWRDYNAAHSCKNWVWSVLKGSATRYAHQDICRSTPISVSSQGNFIVVEF